MYNYHGAFTGVNDCTYSVTEGLSQIGYQHLD